jgi:exonuclease III
MPTKASFKILFWNVKAQTGDKMNIAKVNYLEKLLLEEKPQLVCLCEHRFITQRVNRVIRGYTINDFDRFLIFFNLNNGSNEQTRITFTFDDNSRIVKSKLGTIWIKINKRFLKMFVFFSTTDIKIIHFCHLLDMQNYSEFQRLAFAQKVADNFNLNNHEKQSHVILGDFNMFPYESGMQEVLGFNSYSTLDHDNYFTKKFQGIERIKYYNPFWSLYGNDAKNYQPNGDVTRLIPNKVQPKHGGTFRKSREQAILDQALIPIYCLDEYRASKVFHEGFNYSDHAPILLEMNW